jgi:DNA-binding response OmpR family regulator
MPAGPILVLDDDEANRLAVTSALEDEGYFVIGAGTAQAGLAALEAHRPSLVLLGLQSDDGQVLIQDAFTQGLQFALCVLGVSGERAEWAADVGADYLAQPVEPAVLLARVQELAGPPE